MCPYSLANLVARCAAGDVAALGVLFDRIGTLVDRDVTRAGSAREHDDAVRRVFLRIWRDSGSYDERSEPALGWIGQRVEAECGETAFGWSDPATGAATSSDRPLVGSS